MTGIKTDAALNDEGEEVVVSGRDLKKSHYATKY